MIVNPWGEVVAKLGEEPKEPQIATAEIDFDFFSRVRTKMRLSRGVHGSPVKIITFLPHS